jgi:protein SCO1
MVCGTKVDGRSLESPGKPALLKTRLDQMVGPASRPVKTGQEACPTTAPSSPSAGCCGPWHALLRGALRSPLGSRLRLRSKKNCLIARTVLPVLVFALAAAALAQPGQPAPAQPSFSMQDSNLKLALPGALQGVGIDQRLDAQVPLNLVFRDESGRPVPLAAFFAAGKPAVLALVYYRCPMLCTQILTGLESSLKAVSFNPGRDFEVVVVSIDPQDTPELAAAKRQMYVKRYSRPGTANGWHFLTGEETNIRALADAVGFHYRYDPATQQFAHASGIMILTPEGRVSRYFYGVEYAPRDVRLGLIEASANKIGNPVDQILLFCFHYDPATGKYGAIAMNVLRIAAAAFLLAGGAVLLILFRRDFERRAGSLRRLG